MDSEQQTVPELPQNLVEKVVGRIQFPFVLKARQLSRVWKGKLLDVIRRESPRSYLSALRDIDAVVYSEDEGLLASPMELGPQGPRNPSYTPNAFLTRLRLQRRVTNTFQIEPCGALVLTHPTLNPTVHVINVFTAKTREIPFGRIYLSEYMPVFLVPDGESHYQIVTVDDRRGSGMSILLYKSGRDSWERFAGERALMPSEKGRAAYLDGDLYYLTHRQPNQLVRLNLRGGNFTAAAFPILADGSLGILYRSYAVRCGDAGLFIAALHVYTSPFRVLWRMYEVGRQSLSVEEKCSRAPTYLQRLRVARSFSFLLRDLAEAAYDELGLVPVVRATGRKIYLCANYWGYGDGECVFDVYDTIDGSWSTMSVVRNVLCFVGVDLASIDFFAAP